MYPVVEIGRPRDKKDPAYYFKSYTLFTFSEWKLGKRILGFFLRYLCQQLNPRVRQLCRITHKYMS